MMMLVLSLLFCSSMSLHAVLSSCIKILTVKERSLNGVGFVVIVM
jgi:hypothetical protein